MTSLPAASPPAACLRAACLRAASLPAASLPAVLALLLSAPAAAQDLRLVTWNIAGPERDAAALAQSAEDLVAAIGPVDVLVLQEVISDEQVAAVADALGHAYWVVSDFSPPADVTGTPFASLEVAVTSTLPIEGAGEWDPTGQEETGDGFAPNPSSELIPTEELAVTRPPGGLSLDRGFLRVDLAGDLSVYSVHWKSSRGQSCNAADLGFAQQREAQAAAAVEDAALHVADGRTVVVAGDLNIQAPGRTLRVGTEPAADCEPTDGCEGVCGVGGAGGEGGEVGAGGEDGYDDSIALLLEGLEGARLLSGDLPATYLARSFPGGAIDHVVVAGPLAGRFSEATLPDELGSSFAGSDHSPVVTILASEGPDKPDGLGGLGEPIEEDDEARVLRLLDEIRDRLDEVEDVLGGK